MPSLRYPLVLALVAAGILGIGTLLKPKKPAPPVVSESETVRLERLAQRRTLEQMSAYFSGVAEDAGRYLLRVEPGGGSALVWSEQVVLATELGDPLPRFVQMHGPEGIEVSAELAVTMAELSLAAARPQGGALGPPPRPADAEQPRPGAWVVQASRHRSGTLLFTPALYGGAVDTQCGGEPYREIQISVPVTDSMMGGGVFDVRGNLLAAIARCGQRYAAIESSSLHAALERAGTFEGQLRNRYGLRVSALDDASRAYFGTESGALVAEIWKGRLAERAGLRPGDILLALDGEPVAGPADLDRLTLPLARASFEVTVLRDRRKVELALPAVPAAGGAAPPGSDILGVRLADDVAGYPVEAVYAGSPAHRAGIRAGDRLLSAGGRQITGPAAVRRVLSARESGGRYLVFQRGPRRFGVLLEP
jgi:serine protease Do